MTTSGKDVTTTGTEIEWSKYAEHYDSMCKVNPSYDEMIGLVLSSIETLNLSPRTQVLDIGAGTGNLISQLAPKRPNWNFVHLDFDRGMNKMAKEKYSNLNLSNVSILERAAEDANFKKGSFDLILTTNAVYAIPEHERLLQEVYQWLSPEGAFVAVDFGRVQNTTDWLIYFAKHLLKTEGIRETYRTFKKNWEAAKQNRRTSAAQDEGNYWVHDTPEFERALVEAGFKVQKTMQCYRGYSDLAVCTKT